MARLLPDNWLDQVIHPSAPPPVTVWDHAVRELLSQHSELALISDLVQTSVAMRLGFCPSVPLVAESLTEGAVGEASLDAWNEYAPRIAGRASVHVKDGELSALLHEASALEIFLSRGCDWVRNSRFPGRPDWAMHCNGAPFFVEAKRIRPSGGPHHALEWALNAATMLEATGGLVEYKWNPRITWASNARRTGPPPDLMGKAVEGLVQVLKECISAPEGDRIRVAPGGVDWAFTKWSGSLTLEASSNGRPLCYIGGRAGSSKWMWSPASSPCDYVLSPEDIIQDVVDVVTRPLTSHGRGREQAERFASLEHPIVYAIGWGIGVRDLRLIDDHDARARLVEAIESRLRAAGVAANVVIMGIGDPLMSPGVRRLTGE